MTAPVRHQESWSGHEDKHSPTFSLLLPFWGERRRRAGGTTARRRRRRRSSLVPPSGWRCESAAVGPTQVPGGGSGFRTLVVRACTTLLQVGGPAYRSAVVMIRGGHVPAEDGSGCQGSPPGGQRPRLNDLDPGSSSSWSCQRKRLCSDDDVTTDRCGDRQGLR